MNGDAHLFPPPPAAEPPAPPPASGGSEEDARHRALGMTDDEYDAVVATLGREPNDAELAAYSVMWSEHCSYKSSRAHLGQLSSEGPRVVVGPGEGAGVVDIGDGWLVALRIESHNHPSFVEPYQGAATGVGGILRDVFSVGARPIGLWNQIRFGDLDDPANRYLFGGVVAGIAGYGNAVGVPTLGGEVGFDDSYASNPLVNVLCVGVLRADELVLAKAGREGDVAVLLGAATGRDGIGGASILASAALGEDSGAKRPSVQIGDPFEEKKLIEACLELYRGGLVAGIQDLGAAGIACATSEIAAKGAMGMDVILDRVHLREPGMSAAEILTSESQERMLAIVDPEHLDAVLAVADRWDVEASPIGVVRPGGRLRAYHGGELAADVPAMSLADAAPRCDRPVARPDWLEPAWAGSPDTTDAPSVPEALLSLLDSPALGDKSWVYEQYDHMLFLGSVVPPGHAGALLRVGDTGKGLAVSTDGHGRRCLLDPRRGAARLIFEAALNVAVTGAAPIAVVDNLNFGNPERPEVMWQFTETVAGLAAACRILQVPVVGGNVSFYNETGDAGIVPTPVVGMLGLADPMPERPPRLDQAQEGMELWLFGPQDTEDFAASDYAAVLLDDLSGRPAPPDPAAGLAAVAAARTLAANGTAAVLHDVGDGGLAVAVAEICIRSGVGAGVEVEDWRELFAEGPHRFLAVLEPERRGTPLTVPGRPIPARLLGRIGGDTIDFGRLGSVPLVEAAAAWRQAIPRRMK